jgi:DNA uptake protein ComE-like DNA-binding protein
MNFFKSYFWYNKNQRNGIFFLVMLIIIIQLIIHFGDFSSEEKRSINSSQVLTFQQQIDSLKTLAVEKRKPKLFPFNPNYITDYKGEQLGMSLKEIDRLLAFRNTNKFINSKKEFQQVTKVSDSLLNKMSPYFKFPDWVVNKRKETPLVSLRRTKQSKYKKSISTTDINKATVEDFKTIRGIGPAFSERIIQYRSKLQGFSFESQIYEIWGIEKEVAKKVISTFQIVEKPILKKTNVNTATFKELLKTPYVNYDLCKKILEYRDEVAELQNISELKNIKDFPLELYDQIVLYLFAQ